MTTPEDVVDLVSTPPPPSPTPVFKEQELAQQSVSPLDLYKNKIPKSVKENFDKEIKIKAFFETLPKLFQSAQKIQTKAPLYTGSRIFGHLTSTFNRTNQEGDVIGHI